jgi:hypothetical protein
MRAQGRQLARQAVHDRFLFLLEFEVHFCRSHWARMTHGRARRIYARQRYVTPAWAQWWKGMALLC